MCTRGREPLEVRESILEPELHDFQCIVGKAIHHVMSSVRAMSWPQSHRHRLPRLVTKSVQILRHIAGIGETELAIHIGWQL